MEVVKRDVDELNELAEKMTGTNPKATTTSGALNYIEQNYTGGENHYNLVIDQEMQLRYFFDTSKYGTQVKITNEDDIAKLQALESAVNANNNLEVRIDFNGWYVPCNLKVAEGRFGGIQAEIMQPANMTMYEIYIYKYQDDFYITPDVYQFERPSQ